MKKSHRRWMITQRRLLDSCPPRRTYDGNSSKRTKARPGPRMPVRRRGYGSKQISTKHPTNREPFAYGCEATRCRRAQRASTPAWLDATGADVEIHRLLSRSQLRWMPDGSTRYTYISDSRALSFELRDSSCRVELNA